MFYAHVCLTNMCIYTANITQKHGRDTEPHINLTKTSYIMKMLALSWKWQDVWKSSLPKLVPFNLAFVFFGKGLLNTLSIEIFYRRTWLMYDKNPRYLMKFEGTTECIMTQNNIKLNIIYFSNKIKFCYSFYNMTFFYVRIEAF